MTILFASVLAALNLVWLFLTALGLPGNWLMVLGTALVAWWQPEPAMFSHWTLVAIFLLALFGEAAELLAGAFGARRGGATWRGGAGAIAGGILGGLVGTAMIPVPVLGTLLGAGAGAFVGAVLMELAGGRGFSLSLRSGRGAAIGYGVGVLSKVGIGAAIWLTVTVAAFWP